MRPPRVVIAVAFFMTTLLLTFLSLRSSHAPSKIPSNLPTVAKTSGVQSFFSFRTPFSLFPPNAIITLTHDNTTAFLARPANFGPLLPPDGLKGQVWIGSGFGDDGTRQGAISAAAEGELGCSDVPGWGDDYLRLSALTSEVGKSTDGKTATTAGKQKPQKRSSDEDGPFGDRTEQEEGISGAKDREPRPLADDGTDDYLHHPLPESTVSKPNAKNSAEVKGDHADIQSIQEGAEIAGKIVLLSRGGCGFLEKVKWAQRRGAIALMVGDNQPGGPLIQMYARGDTSNVTIPSIFTSRTTAHLLSSLIGPGRSIQDVIDETGKPALKVQHTDKKKGGSYQDSRPNFTPTTAFPRATGVTRIASKAGHKKPSQKTKEETSEKSVDKPGWLKSLFFGPGKGSKSEASRPPSSGRLGWVLVDEWKDDDEPKTKKISTDTSQKIEDNIAVPDPNPASKGNSGDDFVIGVQDWRDPDLVGEPRVKDADGGKKVLPSKPNGISDVATERSPVLSKSGKKHLGGALQEIPDFLPPLRGGSITPGSGEYKAKNTGGEQAQQENEPQTESLFADGKSKGILTTIFGDDEENVEFLPSEKAELEEAGEEYEDGDSEDEGLWVTLTPTSGASPFLDTLLVLVVSPLVTLTIVYALLLIRSRIRRRRWRAPKSVVERLPVRTYQTVLPSGSASPRTPSPSSSSANTPLLSSSPPSRPRPRSRTTTGIPEPGDLVRINSSPLQMPAIPPRAPEHEKNASESSEWKKHMSKQVECVVCLEEYVDGVSRVMSLPCGHEFHADCITPWLTKRRRTCPICKGDVVRSLARGSPAGPRYEPYHDDSDDDAQVEAAETVDEPSSSALPIAGSFGSNDVEQASPTRPRRSQQASSWRALLANSLGSSSRSPQPPQEDRDR
ncbi:uncharacterized protein L3040_006071 [Drepanopeziza brunnea f. sp. 'multigermtubi']|uniref:C3HC4 type (RING finger) zinc finger containing protein n=1 Tax=Marssonina brunnea f. sp. multigermtubi (strain MB_m1) TaxID=1072389 RepID=K1WV82_MARBU|nr:C3HC4 type (RING finger) zinc finger containing protein [Drepanopeziza brunnea f. sp. 'multigermtubi' MB_m1]EKD21550.1 C3HC4 type (RING finger) zinc finger containing protein [Drepanopeziza brunnea f. sp. 'multigermtubi' MB_m1]KAJ5040415.1 hypothetical protein L3040_006071 [Drepanopeziza brunnea f. sp. 'multigermtubi']